MDEKIKYFTLPNFFTLLNLIAGSLAVIFASDLIIDKLYIASYLVMIALVFDFFDGFLARATNTVSKFGKELDSLADLVSFGVAPALIIFQMIKMALDIKAVTLDLPFGQLLMLVSPIILIVAGFLRLAKFNVNDKQNKKFLGLAIPASAVFFSSFAILFTFDTSKSYEFILFKFINDGSSPFILDILVLGLYMFVFSEVWLYIISIFVFAFLQLVNLPMFSLKFEGRSFKKNEVRYIFVILTALLIIVFQGMALPLIVLLYILISIGLNIADIADRFEYKEQPGNRMIISVVSLVIFLPFGIAALINTLRVNKLLKADDVENANKASRNAFRWAVLSFYTALIIGVVYWLMKMI